MNRHDIIRITGRRSHGAAMHVVGLVRRAAPLPPGGND